MSMYMYEGTNAVNNAKITTAVFAILFLVAGVILLVYGIGDYEEWAVITGLSLLGATIPLFIARAVLRGFQSVVRASETYLKGIEEKEVQKAKEEDKTIRVPMQ